MILTPRSADAADAAIAQVAALARAGGIFGIPTETVYGLAGDAANDAAVARIYEAKGRPAGHPIIVHVHAAPDAHQFASLIPDFAQRLMDAFWPGPLTLILPRRAGVAAAAAGGQDSVGLRCPSHPVARAVLQACAALGVHGLAAPSANRFGKVSPTTAAHVIGEFGEGMTVLDGGPCDVGIESTIVDCTRGHPVLLRPGAITRQQVEAACGVAVRERDAQAPRASGTLEAHYAPAAPLRLMDARSLQTALDVLGADAAHIAVYSRAALRCRSSRVLLRRMPDDPVAAARQLFATLRDFDAQGARLIWVEAPPADVAWEGVADRLRRAAADSKPR